MVGINGQRIIGSGISEADTIPSGGGIFGPQARAQYAALARLRWHMFIHGLRSRKGALELGARTVSFVFYGIGGLAMGGGAGLAAFLLAAGNQWRFLPVLFWAVFFAWQLVPIMLASFQEQFDLGILLRFPVRFGSYYLLYVVFGLLDVSTILGALCCTGVLVGITLARPTLFAWTTLALIIFAAFNILLVRAIFAWIDRWLAQRKTREILGAIFMVLILSLQLLNPALHRHRQEGNGAPLGRNAPREQAQQKIQQYQQSRAEFQARYGPWVATANEVQQWLPPGLAAKALQQRVRRQSEPELEPVPRSGSLLSLGVLCLYVLGAGGGLAARLRAEYSGESLGVAPSRKKTSAIRSKSTRRESRGLLDGPGPTSAVIEKELRTLLRTMPLLYAIGAPLLLLLVFSGAFIRNGPQAHIFPLALPLCIVYAQLGFTRLFYNNMGAEGMGIQLYFLSPTPMRTVMLAKNLFHSVLFGLTILVAGTLTILRLGVPEGVVVAATVAWLLFSLPTNLAAGNIFSLTMPYRVNPGRITRQGGSQANALGALLAQLVTMGVGAAVFGLCWYLNKMWLAVPIFLVLAVGATILWMRILRNADAMAINHRDKMIAALMKQ